LSIGRFYERAGNIVNESVLRQDLRDFPELTGFYLIHPENPVNPVQRKFFFAHRISVIMAGGLALAILEHPSSVPSHQKLFSLTNPV
jgi:hypothetical protein